MSGLKILYNLILKNVAKESGQASGILSIGKDVRKLADKKFQRYVTTAQKQGVDLDKLSEQEIKYMMELNKPKAPQVLSNEEAYEFLNKFLNQGKKDKGKVIKGKFGKSFLEELSSADNAADDILVEQMYRTSGPRDLETDSSFLASFIAEDAGKVLDDLPIKEQTKFIERAKNALRRNVKQYQPRETEIIKGIQTTRGLGDLFPKQLEKTITVESVIEDIDLVLIMSVNPGFGGQKFIHSSIDKISKVRKMIDDSGRDIRLEVDGGINSETIGLASEAGADTFVAGSAIFNTENYEQTISELRSKIV